MNCSEGKCRSFDSAEVRFAQDDGISGSGEMECKCGSFDSAEVRFAQDDKSVGVLMIVFWWCGPWNE